MCSSPLRSLRRFLFITVLAFLLPTAATAQTVSVESGTTVRIQNGATWNLENGTMDFGVAGSTAQLDEQSGGRVTGGSLVATRSLSSPSSADPAGLGLQLTASADLGDVTLTRGHSIQTAPNGNESIERFYDVSPSQNNSGLDAELTFTYNDAELNGRTESELEFFKSTDGGSSWSEEGFDSRDANANTVTLGGIASLSRWTLGSENSPLPVELTTFNATADGQTVQLTWKTTSETQNAGFEIERTNGDADAWTQVGFVEGPGTTSEPQTYAFTDADFPYEAETLRYRLKQVDLDGESEYSPGVEVALGVPDALTLHGNFPNPFTGQTTIRYELPQTDHVRIVVYDLLGRKVATLVDDEQDAGRHQIQFGARDLASGMYIVRLSANGTTQTQKIRRVR